MDVNVWDTAVMQETPIPLDAMVRARSLGDGVMSPGDAEDAALVLRALADPVRLRLLAFMAGEGGADVCICHMPGVVGLSQPTVSHHMKRLLEAGLVTREQRGKWAYFTIVPARFEAIRDVIRVGGQASDGQLR